MRLGCSTYSFWHFRGPKEPLAEYMERAYRHGFDGVEVLEEHVESLDPGYLASARREAFDRGLDIYAVSIHNNFVKPSREERDAEVERVARWIEAAYRLGAKALRVNSGRWGTVKSFDELMERRGLEPPLPGYTLDDAFEWAVESLRRLAPVAEEHGVVLGLENHWGLTRDAGGVLRILRGVGSRWVGAIMDVGNFLEDMYRQLEAIAPYTVLVHAKTYYGGGEWYSLDIDYDRVFDILRRHGYRGWVTLEYEGRAPPEEGVAESYRLLRRYIRPP